ncbi:MAG: Na/Pi cotransporter family protein, partial [Clostridiales bacterium]|nr:Na/Pi cotransporter family protein [Clostridiales bacterium]
MDVFSVLTLAGGIAFFLYGMHVLSTGLEKMAGGSLEQIIKKLTSDSIKGLAFGAGITIALQSSTTVTVMLVGLVNSGIMGFSQAVPIIMGTNIGTTITAWILSLVGLESGNIFVNMLKPENFSLLFALAGIVLMMMSKKPKRRDIGSVFIGFAILMFGMKLMSGAVAPLADKPSFISLMTVFKNPILAVILGAVITIVVQSSAA